MAVKTLHIYKIFDGIHNFTLDVLLRKPGRASYIQKPFRLHHVGVWMEYLHSFIRIFRKRSEQLTEGILVLTEDAVTLHAQLIYNISSTGIFDFFNMEYFYSKSGIFDLLRNILIKEQECLKGSTHVVGYSDVYVIAHPGLRNSTLNQNHNFTLDVLLRKPGRASYIFLSDLMIPRYSAFGMNSFLFLLWGLGHPLVRRIIHFLMPNIPY
ncbi:hypothetical protein ACJX0J_012679 [Zea mays]